MIPTSGAVPFCVGLALIAGVVALGVYQVPQPWRGVLVTVILLMLTVGTFVLRLLRHHYEYKRTLLNSRQPPTPAPRRKRRAPSPSKRLNVINSRSTGGGRSVI